MKINSLAKKERLSSRKDIDLLFKKGKVVRTKYFRVFYLLSDQEDHTTYTKAFFSVPKRLHKRAVKRNLLKRRLKEAYRLNNSVLKTTMEQVNKTLFIGFAFASKEEVTYKAIEQEMIEALDKVKI